MKKFLIEYECAHWCGGISRCVVDAETAEDAVSIAWYHMEEGMRELFADEYFDDEEDSYEDESAVSVIEVQEFDESHEYWKYYVDPVQSQFFPQVS